MDTQQIVFYLKRHLLGIVGLLLSIGFIFGGIMFKGKFADKVTGAEEAYSNAKKKRDEIQGSANETKVDGANVAVLGDVADEYRKFIADAGQVLKKESFPAMKSNDFLNLMTQTIVLLNQEATNNLVKVRNDLLTRSDINFSFTFAPLMEQAEIAEDKIPELQVQMEDIKTISQVLFESQVRSLELLQRNRVTTEDFAALQNPNYLDIRDKYTNSISVVRPYRIKFRSLSGGIAKVLSGFAKQETFYTIRTMEVTPVNAAADGASDELDMGMGSMEGGDPSEMGLSSGEGGVSGYPEGAGAGMTSGTGAGTTTNIVHHPYYVGQLVRSGLTSPPATNVIGEVMLEVVMDLDSIRSIIEPPNAEPDGSGQNQPGVANPPKPAPAP
ncbi:MAG: hypothetical protein ACJZ65_02010 [Limisphaerales bacterium]